MQLPMTRHLRFVSSQALAQESPMQLKKGFIGYLAKGYHLIEFALYLSHERRHWIYGFESNPIVLVKVNQLQHKFV
jgi:hypothetical protein